MEYLRFDCTMMPLGIIQEFAPLEEHLKGQGPWKVMFFGWTKLLEKSQLLTTFLRGLN